MLSEEILDFCDVAKTASQISGKFHRYGETRVQAALKQLEKQGRLKSFYKGTFKVFQNNSED